jgi:DnaK suppressor protein
MPTKTAAKKKAPAKTKKTAARSSAKRVSTTEFRDFEPYKPKRGEEYMSEAQREHFKNILRKWKGELMEEVDRTVTHMKDEAANFPDPADRATQEEEFSLELRTRDRERKLIKKIDSTIERIEQDDYGFCDACGVEIGIRRLEARPTANLCIDCKTLDEIKEKQERG